MNLEGLEDITEEIEELISKFIEKKVKENIEWINNEPIRVETYTFLKRDIYIGTESIQADWHPRKRKWNFSYNGEIFFETSEKKGFEILKFLLSLSEILERGEKQ